MEHFVRRSIEYWFAFQTALFGVWIGMPAVAFGTPAYTELLRVMPEGNWATVFVSFGTSHAITVYVNGSAWWTPLARMFTSAITTACYVVFAMGFSVAVPASTAVFTYMALSAAGLICFYKATADASKIEWRQHVHR